MLRVSHGQDGCHEPSAIEWGGAVLRRISAFTTTADGGNPAAVWISDELPTVEETDEMLDTIPPTQEEAHADAAATINEDNADAEFERLKAEIESGEDG